MYCEESGSGGGGSGRGGTEGVVFETYGLFSDVDTFQSRGCLFLFSILLKKKGE